MTEKHHEILNTTTSPEQTNPPQHTAHDARFGQPSEDAVTFSAFTKFVMFYSELFAKPGFLDDVPCRKSYKEYVPDYYAKTFGPGINEIQPRHLKWYRSLSPLFSLPHGSRILDYGGGYGLDSIFLASLGYQMVFYEITPHHIAIAKHFSERFAERFGELPIRFVLAGEEEEPHDLDAVLFNEVAHHIEPVQRTFGAAATMLRNGGHLFLLEPNFFCPAVQVYFFKERGFTTVEKRVDELTGQQYLWGNENIRPVPIWNRHARIEGFELHGTDYVIPWFMRGEDSRPSLLRQGLEKLPVTRHLLASHVMLHYVKQ